ncbi:MAG: DUF5050 domain-containing protein [Lachnospiraceae bacterium]|nr:DUF5050 domain-containing protein [Lachnospiraceae bacterium]
MNRTKTAIIAAALAGAAALCGCGGNNVRSEPFTETQTLDSANESDGSQESRAGDGTETEDTSRSLLDTVYRQGGDMLVYNDRLYFANQKGDADEDSWYGSGILYSVKLDGTDKQRVSDADDVYCVSEFNGNIYYVSSSNTSMYNGAEVEWRGLHSVKPDGTGDMYLVGNSPGRFAVANDRIYVYMTNLSMGIYSYGLDGGNERELTANAGNNFIVVNNQMFYSGNYDDGRMCVLDVTDEEFDSFFDRKVIGEETGVSNFDYKDGYLYYTSTSESDFELTGNNDIYRMDLDTYETELLGSDTCYDYDYLHIEGNSIIYRTYAFNDNYDYMYSVYVMDLDGANKQLVFESVSEYSIDIYSNNGRIYYQNSDGDLWSVNLSGGDKIVMN